MEFDNNETVLDVINERLQTLNAKSFILRVAFVSEYDFEDKKSFAEKYRAVIERINSNYCDVSINGVILIYKTIFYVICEGSENTIARQINSVFNEFGTQIGKSKLLFVYHNVRERQFFTWTSVYAEPVDQNEKFDQNYLSMDDTKHFQGCIDKLKYLNEILDGKRKEIESSYKDFPDYNLTNNILCSSQALDLREYASMYLNLIDYSYCFENSWPAPYDFTPYLETTELQKTYVELLSNIDDFSTDQINLDTNKNAKVNEFIEDKTEIADTAIDKINYEQTFRINEMLNTRLSLDEYDLIQEIELFEKLNENIEGSLKENSLSEKEVHNEEQFNENKSMFGNTLSKTNSEQIFMKKKTLKTQLSLDESELIQELRMMEKINEIVEKEDSEIVNEKTSTKKDFLKIKLSLDEFKLIQEIDIFNKLKENVVDEDLNEIIKGEKLKRQFSLNENEFINEINLWHVMIKNEIVLKAEYDSEAESVKKDFASDDITVNNHDANDSLRQEAEETSSTKELSVDDEDAKEDEQEIE